MVAAVGKQRLRKMIDEKHNYKEMMKICMRPCMFVFNVISASLHNRKSL